MSDLNEGFNTDNLFSSISCMTCDKAKNSSICRPLGMTFENGESDEQKKKSCGAECSNYNATTFKVEDDICACINTYVKCDETPGQSYCTDPTASQEQCQDKCVDKLYQQGNYNEKCVCRYPYPGCTGGVQGSCQTPHVNGCEQDCVDYGGSGEKKGDKCLCKNSTEDFIMEGMTCAKDDEAYVRTCDSGSSIPLEPDSAYTSNLQLESGDSGKGDTVTKAFCACESGDDSIKKNFNNLNPNDPSTKDLFNIWNETINDSDETTVLCKFKDKVNAQYDLTEQDGGIAKENVSNLQTGIANLLCEVNSQNQSRSKGVFGIVNTLSWLDRKDAFKIIFKAMIYILLTLIIITTFYPRVLGDDIPFENSLIYAMLFPYTKKDQLQEYIKLLFCIALVIYHIVAMRLYAKADIDNSEATYKNEINGMFIAQVVVLFLSLVLIYRKFDKKAIGGSILVLGCIQVTLLVLSYLSDGNYLRLFAGENIVLILLFVYFLFWDKSNLSFKLVTAIIVINIGIIMYYHGQIKVEENESKLTTSWGLRGWNIFLYLAYIVLAFVAARMPKGSKGENFVKFFVIFAALWFIGLVIYYNFMIAVRYPVIEFVLLMMYKLVPDFFSFFLNKKPDMVNKLRVGESSKLYTFLTLFKKPSENWALPFLNIFLLPAVIYSNRSGNWADYFNAKEFKTSW